MFTLIFVVIVFIILILPHELGHLLMAKKFGIRVDKFSFGFGPRLWGIKRGETEYVISAFPLGGYVKIAGMQPGEENTKDGFQNKSLGQRILVICAGPLMNYLISIVLLAAVFMIGFYTVNINETIVGQVVVNSPAEEAGILPGDRIIQINGRPVHNWNELSLLITEGGNETLALSIERKTQTFIVKMKPIFDPELKRKIIGISQPMVYVRYNPLEALGRGAERAVFITGVIISAVGGMIKGTVPAEFTGPVGIVQFVGQSARMGAVNFLALTALLSINLGLFNLLPIPALDGGRLLFLIIEGIWGRPINMAKQELIHYLGFIILMALVLLVTYQDIVRLVGR